MESTGRLVLAGAGHAHLRLIHTISRLRAQNISVTVVDPGDTLWYSGMMPAVLGGTVDPSAARINVRAIVERQGGEYVSEALTEIRADDRTALTASGRTLPWDVMSVAVGSTVVPPFPVAPSGNLSVFAAKPIVALLELSRCVRELIVSRTALGDERPVRVAFVGGGPSTVELAGNLAGGILRDRSDAGSRLRIGVYTQAERLLPRMPVAAATAAERSLASQGVAIRYGTQIRRITETGLELGDATVEEWDVAVLATGLGAPELFRRSGLPTETDGALRVGSTLRIAGAPIYGGGDCISIEGLHLARAGVHAVRQQHVLVHNIAAELGVELQKPPTRRDRRVRRHPAASDGLITYAPPTNPLQILNLGDGTALFVQGGRVRRGRLPALLKERIDWGFVASEGRSLCPALRPPPRPPHNGTDE
jgi:NADH dehydrogenase FAD-containing subunit